jgi:hypothetical protein
MRAEFNFDGDELRIYIKVEDRCEVALARVMEKYTRASVSLSYPDGGMYSYERDPDPKAIRITLREAPKCPSTGTWCERNCPSHDCALNEGRTVPGSDAAGDR